MNKLFLDIYPELSYFENLEASGSGAVQNLAVFVYSVYRVDIVYK